MALRTATGKRRLSVPGCFDFRDVGGYRTIDGRRIRWRRLFRSDSLHHLTATGRLEIENLKVASVLDLRTPEEVAEQGSARLTASQHHLSMAEVLPSAPGTGGCHAESALVSACYARTLTSSVETVRQLLALLADPTTYPAVICCSSGVDRTGMVAGLVMGLLGVPDAAVVSDFAASREATLRWTGRLRFEHPSVVSQEIDRFGLGLLGVVPEAMSRFLAGVRVEHGSFAGYAESIDMGGVVPYLRAALLQP